MAHALGIRAAEGSDVAAIRAIAMAAYASYVQRMSVPPQPLTADYARVIAASDTWLPEASGRVAGFVVLDAHDTFWIENIAVDPSIQSRGVGSRLLHHAEQKGRARGFDRVHLYTPATAHENRAWYAHHGYMETDRRMEDGRDRVFFEKPLR